MLQSIMRIPRMLSQVMLAMVIGHAALIYILVFHRDLSRILLRSAKVVKEFIVTYLAPAVTKHDQLIELLLEEKALLFMFFTVVARLLLDVIIEMVTAIWRLLRH